LEVHQILTQGSSQLCKQKGEPPAPLEAEEGLSLLQPRELRKAASPKTDPAASVWGIVLYLGEGEKGHGVAGPGFSHAFARGASSQRCRDAMLSCF